MSAEPLGGAILITPENAGAKLAGTAFGVLAAFKLIGALFGARLLVGTPNIPDAAIAKMIASHRYAVAGALVVYFGTQFVLCLALRRGLREGRRWSFSVGYGYSVFHILGLIAVPWLGMVLLINAAMGLIAFVGVRRAASGTSAPAPPN